MRTRRPWNVLLAGSGVAVVVSMVGIVPASAREPDVPTGPAQPVIVVLADQHDDVPATAAGSGRRRAMAQADQQPLVDQARQAGAANIKQFSVVNGFAATMTAAAQEQMTSDPRVRAVVPDSIVRSPRHRTPTGAARGATAVSGICPADPARPQLEPEALALTRATQAQELATGKGVRVGIVAAGLDAGNPDLIRTGGSR